MQEFNFAGIGRRFRRHFRGGSRAGGDAQGSCCGGTKQAAASNLGHGSLPCSGSPLIRSVDNSMTVCRKFVYKRGDGPPDNYRIR